MCFGRALVPSGHKALLGVCPISLSKGLSLPSSALGRSTAPTCEKRLDEGGLGFRAGDVFVAGWGLRGVFLRGAGSEETAGEGGRGGLELLRGAGGDEAAALLAAASSWGPRRAWPSSASWAATSRCFSTSASRIPPRPTMRRGASSRPCAGRVSVWRSPVPRGNSISASSKAPSIPTCASIAPASLPRWRPTGWTVSPWGGLRG